MKKTLLLTSLVFAFGWPVGLFAEIQEYAAGEVTLPFAYSATVATAPRPANLDFAETHGYPDNCQALVRIEGELWQFQSRFGISVSTPHARYAGPDIEHMTRREDSSFPAGYHLAWILGGLWYDEAERKLYAPMHIEAEGIDRNGPLAPWPSRKIILATSTDKGLTWRDEGDIVTPETYFGISDTYKFAGSNTSNGLCDFGFYADVRGGYFYLFPMEAWLTKGAWTCRWTTRAVRCAISDKMAPGKWRFFYNGKWDEPALGGKSSVVAPRVWAILYSTYLKRYISVFPSNADPVGKDNIDGVYLGSCSDLTLQDWQIMRLPEAQFGFMNLLNGDGSNVTECDRNLRLYSYFNGNLYQRLDISLGEGHAAGPGLQPGYTFEGHPESSDAILGRRTKFIGPSHADTHYEGHWSERTDPLSYEGHLMECASAGSTTLSFTGSDVYWRALCSPDSGKAEVYIDGTLRKTVDCYSPQSSDYEQIVYRLSGLTVGVPHSIKVVVRGEKNPASKSALVRHIGFEYAAESYKASAGFSSLMGKEHWSYQQWKGTVDADLHFSENKGVFTNYWSGDGSCRIGPDYQVPDEGSVVRQWIAPHGGAVRLEGKVSVDASVPSASAGVTLNGKELWPTRIVTPQQTATQDITVDVAPGDTIGFVVSREKLAGGEIDPDKNRVIWNPVITYLRPGSPAVWSANVASERNLALGKYARSKRLFHAYTPASAVDGSIETAFTLSEYDPMATGDNWVSIDLNQTYLIDRYVVISTPPNASWRPETFVFQKSDDGFSWTDVERVTKNAHDRIERAVPPFKARYVRLYLPGGKPVCINELGVYYTEGKPVSDNSKGLTLR